MKKMMLSLLGLSLGLALLVAACDSGSSDNQETLPQDLVTQDEGTAGPEDLVTGDSPALDYPAPPYGLEAGSTVANHTFFDPESGGNVALGDLYQAGNKKVLLLTAGAGWCVACKQEAVALKEKYATYADQGLEIWSTLFEDFTGDPPSEGFWHNWVGQTTPTFPVYLDLDFQLQAYFNPDNAPMNMVIRLDTMEIVFLETGFNPDAVEAEIKKLLE